VTELPSWLTEYAQDCRKLFGLDEWEICVKLVKHPGGDDVEREGHCALNYRYLTATIELNETMEEDGLRSTLMHEMLHIVLAPIEQAHDRITELVKKGLRRHVAELMDDGIEQTIERLRRALQREIKPAAKTASENGWLEPVKQD
jgi:hypothetical protein